MKTLTSSLESAPSPNKLTITADSTTTLRRGILRSVQVAAFNALQRSAASLGFGVATYRQPTRAGDFAKAVDVRRSRAMLMTPLEGVQLMNAVKATAKLEGCMAEVGVYAGASARLIRTSDTHRPLHLFDTFAGLPRTSDRDTEFRHGQFQAGEFACSLDSVRSYLSDLSNVWFHPGLFPATGADVSDRHFSFVHIDVDIYESSARSIEWFYPRMVRGGIILSHDFGTCDGPRSALTEFFADKPEPLIELPGDQAMIVKV